MPESFESLRRLLSDAGYAFVEPPIVHDANVFVELAGEDLRRRMFLTSGADGTELALRPDYTIPVCLHHLESGPAKRRAAYAYLGPVFRQRRDEPGEFLQAGIESIGRTDRVAADADVLKLALEATAILGVTQPTVRIGDSALFAAVLDALDLNPPWRKRLARAFGDTARLNALIGKANGKTARRAPSFKPSDGKAALKQAEQLLAASGLAVIGGRTAEEIAERVAEKSALAAGIGGRAARVLSGFLAISGEPRSAAKALRSLGRANRLAIGDAIDFFERRNDAFETDGIDLARLSFAADFGRRLDYYTGFVFEVHDAQRPGARQIVGGGRYDRMLGLILKSRGKAKGEAFPAVGFSIWLDRIGAAA
jgi:ATP phosphoribosyltransferase regulatory subunit